MRNLRCDVVECERGNQANHALWNANGGGDKIGLIKNAVTGQAIHPSAELLKTPAVAEGIERSGMNTELNGA